MYGVYEKTIKRNEKTGETDFLFASDGTKYTVHAEIPFYNKLCPLEVTGRIEKDGTISAKHVKAFGFSEEADKAFLLSKIFRGVVSEETAKKSLINSERIFLKPHRTLTENIRGSESRKKTSNYVFRSSPQFVLQKMFMIM